MYSRLTYFDILIEVIKFFKRLELAKIEPSDTNFHVPYNTIQLTFPWDLVLWINYKSPIAIAIVLLA